jgi:hypothetical protein
MKCSLLRRQENLYPNKRKVKKRGKINEILKKVRKEKE